MPQTTARAATLPHPTDGTQAEQMIACRLHTSQQQQTKHPGTRFREDSPGCVKGSISVNFVHCHHKVYLIS
ncbi:hypothetical protein [uncultured Pontibacter sp.]|uniref:hypothetical protein n=1 Tax=uncultured Pontibacter sp. TaxID=453356 RepID=UPI0026239203|nr:hypothetical protein [uncultured Pontibacter sp.]